MKIDVEGHELSVLRGAQETLAKEKVRFLQFEFGAANIDTRTYLRDFYDLLNEQFVMFRIVADGLYRLDDYSPAAEVFATMNYLAVHRRSTFIRALV